MAGIPLYYLGDTGGSIRLFREFRTLTAVENDPLASAVTALMDPDLGPLDPVYSTPWQKPSWLSVTREGSTVTVDVSPDTFGGSVGSEAALGPGTYTVRVETDDPSDGADPGPHVDDKEFTVQ